MRSRRRHQANDEAYERVGARGAPMTAAAARGGAAAALLELQSSAGNRSVAARGHPW